MKHKFSYTLRVLQLGAPLSVTVKRTFACSCASCCVLFTGNRCTIPLMLKTNWSSVMSSKQQIDTDLQSFFSKHERVLTHASAYYLHHTTLSSAYYTLRFSSQTLHSINHLFGAKRISVEDLFMQDVNFMGSLCCLLLQKHTWGKQVTFQATKHPHASTENYTYQFGVSATLNRLQQEMENTFYCIEVRISLCFITLKEALGSLKLKLHWDSM